MFWKVGLCCFGGPQKAQSQAQHSLQQQQQVPLQHATMNTPMCTRADKRAEACRLLLEGMQKMRAVLNEANMVLRLMDGDRRMFLLTYSRNDEILDLLLTSQTQVPGTQVVA